VSGPSSWSRTPQPLSRSAGSDSASTVAAARRSATGPTRIPAGRGIATAAVAAGCRWAFTHLQMEVILWRAEIGNLPSRRVAENVGFTIEATLRLRLRHRGTRVDAWVGSLLPGELSLRQ
jgi:hypothetical protein